MTRIAGRYTVERKLGEGGFGSTWLALDEESGQHVAIKQFDMRRAQDWKAVELFEREARVLRGLAHPAIPAYLDYVEQEDEGTLLLYLVQAVAPGRPLSEWTAELGWRPGGAELRALALDLLGILDYLHALHPPVVHRDIKPHNILRDAQGKLSLVDFGSVKATIGDERGSTVVGSFGYMAPEQFRGHADPRTDLYGVGATLLHVMTGAQPSDLPMRKLKIDVRGVLGAHPLVPWLERVLEPDLEDRFASAHDARDALERTARQLPEPADHTNMPEGLREQERLGRGEVFNFEPSLAAGSEPEEQEEEEQEPLLDRQPRMRPGDKGWMASMTPDSIWGARVFGLGLAVLSVASFIGPTSWFVLSALALTPLCMILFSVCIAPAQTGNHPASRRRDEGGSVVGLMAGTLAMLVHMVALFLQVQHQVGFWVLFAVIGLYTSCFYGLCWVFWAKWRGFYHQSRLEEALDAELPMHSGEQLLAIKVKAFEPGQSLRLSQRTSLTAWGWALFGVGLLGVRLLFEVHAGVPFGREWVSWFAASAAGFVLLCVSLGVRAMMRRHVLRIDAQSVQGKVAGVKVTSARAQVSDHTIEVEHSSYGEYHVNFTVHDEQAGELCLYSVCEPTMRAATISREILRGMVDSVLEQQPHVTLEFPHDAELAELDLSGEEQAVEAVHAGESARQ